MSHDEVAFDGFRASSSTYFDKYRTSRWQLGAFANYCYGIEGFPQEKKIRKQVAFELWKDRLKNLEDRSEDIVKKEKARKLLKSIRNQQPLYINNIQNNVNFNIQGNSGTINATVNGPTGIPLPETVAGQKTPAASSSQTPVAPPPPYEAPPVTASRTLKRKTPQSQSPGYDGERSSSPSPGPSELHSLPSKKARCAPAAAASPPLLPPPPSPPIYPAATAKTTAPTPPMPSLPPPHQSVPSSLRPHFYATSQPPRQRLIHVHDQLFKDLLPSQQRIVPFLESTLSSLEHIRKTTLSHLQTTIANLEYIDHAIREVRQVQKSCTGVLEKVDVGLRGVIEHPLLVGDDEMLTEKDESVAGSSSFCAGGSGGEGGSGERVGERKGQEVGDKTDVKNQYA